MSTSHRNNRPSPPRKSRTTTTDPRTNTEAERGLGPSLGRFTEAEMAAAQQLVEMSESSDSHSPSSSDSCSVTVVRPPPPDVKVVEEEEEEEEMEMGLGPRRRQRYRSIVSLYRTTSPIEGPNGEVPGSKKRRG